MNIRSLLLSGACAGAAFGLTACDNGPSAVRTRDRSETAQRYEAASAAREDDSGDHAYHPRTARHSAEAAAQDDDLGGGLRWAANSRHSADDNAHYQFDKRGGDFGVQDFKAFVTKADAFVAHPPEGVLKLERSNGDVLLYDPKSNVFAVADKTGAPRTMFKPSDGLAYWDEQKSKEAGRKHRGSDDGEKS
jgi:pyocin large subunit-like protein